MTNSSLSGQSDPATLPGVDSQDLTARAIEEIGEHELAKRLKYDNLMTAARTIHRWRSGKAKPDYAHTLILLDAAGLLRTEEVVGHLAVLVAELESLRAELEQVRARQDPA